ncbi:MAG: hypothetical protein IPM82_07440 [Saprospiraceae bacterium]|nr:hypothetical protein [Saprospiraceae bacterium]
MVSDGKTKVAQKGAKFDSKDRGDIKLLVNKNGDGICNVRINFKVTNGTTFGGAGKIEFKFKIKPGKVPGIKPNNEVVDNEPKVDTKQEQLENDAADLLNAIKIELSTGANDLERLKKLTSDYQRKYHGKVKDFQLISKYHELSNEIQNLIAAAAETAAAKAAAAKEKEEKDSKQPSKPKPEPADLDKKSLGFQKKTGDCEAFWLLEPIPEWEIQRRGAGRTQPGLPIGS